MTHSLVLEIPEDIYQEIVREAASKKRAIEEVALERLAKTERLSDQEFERLADELADFVEESLPPGAEPLSDYAISREGIYEDRL